MGNLSSFPLGCLGGTVWTTLENHPPERWGRWCVCPPPPISHWWRLAPETSITQRLWPAPCTDPRCCWGWPMLPSREMEEATACMGTSEGPAGRLRRGECALPASALFRPLPLQWQGPALLTLYLVSLCIFLLKQVLQAFHQIWKITIPQEFQIWQILAGSWWTMSETPFVFSGHH